MDFWHSLSGATIVRITTADSAGLIEEFVKCDIELYDLHDGNDLSITGKIRRKDLKNVKRIIKRRQDKLEILNNIGLYWSVRRTLLRPAVILGILLVFLSAVYLPRRVLFVQVQGNHNVPTNLILECAEQCGIGFGTLRSEVRSEKVKNMLLSKIPQIKWIGINTQGCTAVISVREGTSETKTDEDQRVRSIVSACDGIVEQCTVVKGNSLVSPGMAVKAGQVLVSGYTDCGIKIQAVRADAEIFAQTRRTIQVVTPMEIQVRNRLVEEEKKFSLIFGKKQINFYKESGISDTECVKMKSIKYLTLPGGFRLPVGIVTERVYHYDVTNSELTDVSWVDDFAEHYLQSTMVSGRIIRSTAVTTCATNVYVHLGVYDCYEMIGIPKYEEIIG